ARGLARAANALAGRFDRKHRTQPDARIIEGPHCDSRFFTALCGLRGNIHTEVYAGGAWEELPIGLDSIAIFPGHLAKQTFGLSPTLHRVLQSGEAAEASPADARTGNVTLLLGAA